MNRIKCGVLGGGVGGRGQFLGLKYAYIPNLSPLLSLEPFEKFLVGGGGWLRASLVFSFGQAEQNQSANSVSNF